MICPLCNLDLGNQLPYRALAIHLLADHSPVQCSDTLSLAFGYKSMFHCPCGREFTTEHVLAFHLNQVDDWLGEGKGIREHLLLEALKGFGS